MRPLISTGDPKKSVDISRKAELYETSSGMITITGGKLTTWRRMAKLTVDRLVERDAREAPCRTHEIPLGQAVAVEELPRVEGVPEESYAALAARYGYAAHEVLALAAERGELAQPIVPGLPDLLAEVAPRGAPRAGALVGDVLLRRTRLGLLAAHALDGSPRERSSGEGSSAGSPREGSSGSLRERSSGSPREGSHPACRRGPPSPVRRVADVLAGELGWSAQRTSQEIERFAREARADSRSDDALPPARRRSRAGARAKAGGR